MLVIKKYFGRLQFSNDDHWFLLMIHYSYLHRVICFGNCKECLVFGKLLIVIAFSHDWLSYVAFIQGLACITDDCFHQL